MVELNLIPRSEFKHLIANVSGAIARHALFADMCRYNTLTVVKRAGSGHLGSSLSSLDIVAWLYLEVLNTLEVGLDAPGRDVYFSSKGHDVPGFYAVLYALGVLPEDRFLDLRRHGGCDGHPDVRVPGVEANSGSLGMGISKARGMAWARRQGQAGGRVFVMTGDGELQEGQIYESLQSAAHHAQGNLVAIVDHNKVQSDKPVDEILELGDLDAKFASFGWSVARCNGHDMHAFSTALETLDADPDRPKILIADTLKGCGVSFMEHPAALAANGGLYRWHAGAPADDAFEAAQSEILTRVNEGCRAAGLDPVALQRIEPAAVRPLPPVEAPRPGGGSVSLVAPAAGIAEGERELVADTYGEALVEIGRRREDLVVLDADLAIDCRTRAFEQTFPERFVQNGIAEQDMVSAAGGLARAGWLPVVNSFASFLAARANEQIYNNATEGTRILYALHYAGLIPAGPGKSHQSIRDISLLGSLPNVDVVQPANAAETRRALAYAVDEAPGCTALRFVIGPSPRPIPGAIDDWRPGLGRVLRDGDDAAMMSYGPVMLHEALLAAEILQDEGVALRVVNQPWLNRVDAAWTREALACRSGEAFVVEDHAPVGGLGDRVVRALHDAGALGDLRVSVLGVEGHAECGTPPEALRAHGLDGASLAARVLEALEEHGR